MVQLFICKTWKPFTLFKPLAWYLKIENKIWFPDIDNWKFQKAEKNYNLS